jgi:phosphatidylglycerophosphate synthase
MALLPNLLSFARLLLVPVLLVLAWSHQPHAFVPCLIFSLVTDMIDGRIARWLKVDSETGARLDSLADVSTSLALPFCAWWLRPDVILREKSVLLLGLSFFIASLAFGFIKYHRLLSYHTWGNKFVFVVMAVTLPVIFAGGPGWLLRIAMPLVVVSQIEEMAITALLPRWRADVPSLWHALQIKRSAVPDPDSG